MGSKSLDPNLYGIPVKEAIHLPQWRKVVSLGRAEVYERRLVGPEAPAPTLIGPGARQ